MELMPDSSSRKSSKIKRRLQYAWKCLPAYLWQRCTRRGPKGNVHLLLCVADHFEPSSLAGDFSGYASADVQVRRVESWCSSYPKVFDGFRDSEGRPFIHTYFYPAEQYDRMRVQQ